MRLGMALDTVNEEETASDAHEDEQLETVEVQVWDRKKKHAVLKTKIVDPDEPEKPKENHYYDHMHEDYYPEVDEEAAASNHHEAGGDIPRNLTITQADMAQRKVLDVRRWFCMARPQYPKTCGISSLVSCWNFLFSTLGAGTKRPISVEETLEFLGFTYPYDNVPFGTFTGNGTLQQWFHMLNDKFGVKGEAEIIFKVHGKDVSEETADEHTALDRLQSGLKQPDHAYVYHCANHYMCPVGFEVSPTAPQ